MSSREEIYRSASEELRKTMESQRDAYARINQLAVDLAKIDLLAVSAVLAGVSFSALSLSLQLVAGLATFVYALWCCARIFEPRSFSAGIGASTVPAIDEFAREGAEPEEHYRQLMFSYYEAIPHLDAAHASVKETFREALWASVTAIVFFSLVAVRRLAPPYPFPVDVLLPLLVPSIVSLAKDKYERD